MMRAGQRAFRRAMTVSAARADTSQPMTGAAAAAGIAGCVWLVKQNEAGCEGEEAAYAALGAAGVAAIGYYYYSSASGTQALWSRLFQECIGEQEPAASDIKQVSNTT